MQNVGHVKIMIRQRYETPLGLSRHDLRNFRLDVSDICAQLLANAVIAEPCFVEHDEKRRHRIDGPRPGRFMQRLCQRRHGGQLGRLNFRAIASKRYRDAPFARPSS